MAFHKGQLKEHVLSYKEYSIDEIIVVGNKINLLDWSKRSFDFKKKSQKGF